MSSIDFDGVRTPDIARATLIERKDTSGLPWRKFAALDENKPVPPGTLCTFYKTGYLPPKWYAHFGLEPVKKYNPNTHRLVKKRTKPRKKPQYRRDVELWIF